MKASEQIEHATQELSGPLAVSVSFQQELAFRRLQKGGWEFAITCKFPDSVLVCKPNGNEYHLVSDERCDCKGFGFRKHCYHLAAVLISGGVQNVKALIQKHSVSEEVAP